jgi:hypothetical protein
MRKPNKYDVQPSLENKGLLIRATITEGCPQSLLKEHLAQVEKITKTHLAQMASLEQRDLHAATRSGLVIIGPAYGDAASPLVMAFNASMAVIDAKLTEIDAKLAALSAALQDTKKK